MQKNKVSVIIPAHNAESYISRSVCSVLEQSYSDFEVIIVENGSTDRTMEICKQLSEKDRRIRVCQSEKGVSNARNKGLDLACGEWIFFLDADDWLEKESLKI